MATGVTNKFKYVLATGGAAPLTDSFIIILMQSGFTFNKDTHHGYADVSASELATANGYTVKTKALTGIAITEDDTDDRAEITWNNVSWVASGAIGPTPGAIIFDDTVTTPTADPIVGYIDFGGDQTQASGGTLTISNIGFYIA